MEETKKTKLVLEFLGKRYEVGGDGSQPAADSVGSEEIRDGSVEMVDLDPSMITTPQEARDIVAAAIARAEGE